MALTCCKKSTSEFMARVGLHVSRSAPIALRLLERWNRRTAKIEPSNLSDSLRLGFAVCLSSWLQAAKCIDRPQSAQWAVGRGMFCRQVSKLRKHSAGIVCRFFMFFQVISAWHMQQSSCIWQRNVRALDRIPCHTIQV